MTTPSPATRLASRTSYLGGQWCSATPPCSPWTRGITFCVAPTSWFPVSGSPRWAVPFRRPADAVEIDATGGIVMPGMIDTHRHMWQTAMRGYGADWTLTQYFVWYYLEWGKSFRPQDVYAGNLLSRDRGDRRRRDHHGRLVARPADGRARRRRAWTRSKRSPGASSWPTATSSRARGSGRPRRSSATSSAGGSQRQTTCSASRWRSTSPAATRTSRSAPPSRWPASSACR